MHPLSIPEGPPLPGLLRLLLLAVVVDSAPPLPMAL